MAYGPGVPELVAETPGFVDLGLVDYVEVPFEQLRHTPDVIRLQDHIPLTHCASMSVAGFLPPSAATLEAILAETARTATPWIGEHLAFISADGLNEDDAGSVAPTSLTYTVCPQLSEETVERVAENWPPCNRASPYR